jgi:hypothetical protein
MFLAGEIAPTPLLMVAVDPTPCILLTPGIKQWRAGCSSFLKLWQSGLFIIFSVLVMVPKLA